MSDMTARATAGGTDGDFSAVEQRILSFIRKEIQDKTVVLSRETRRDEVAIDSIDVVNVVFALEEEFDIEIDLTPDTKFETIGDLLDTLVSFIPEEKRVS